jgi:Beta-lactamase
LIFLVVVRIADFLAADLCAHEPAQTIRRLDGSAISTAEADAFAKRTLEEQKVTGAQIAAISRGKLVWSVTFGLRGRDPDLLIGRETTTWAASITKSVFATYVMTLVERGEFQLDVPIAKQLEKPFDSYEAYKETDSAIVGEAGWPVVTPAHVAGAQIGTFEFCFSGAGQEAALALQARNQIQLFRQRNQPGAICDRAAKTQAARSADASGVVPTTTNGPD